MEVYTVRVFLFEEFLIHLAAAWSCLTVMLLLFSCTKLLIISFRCFGDKGDVEDITEGRHPSCIIASFTPDGHAITC